MQGDEMRALRRLQREQGVSSHVFMTERDGPMTPKAFHALFGRIGALDANFSIAQAVAIAGAPEGLERSRKANWKHGYSTPHYGFGTRTDFMNLQL
jgi:hypothetical protein